MSANRSQDRASLCSFTFVDGRRCRIPRRHGHPYLCTFHARREAKIFAGEKVGEEIARYLSGEQCLLATSVPHRDASSPPYPKVKSNPKPSLPSRS
jgi:hypothetical protein